MSKVILYGAGRYCERILYENQLREDTLLYICDKDEKKWGTTVGGIRVVAPSEMSEAAYDFIVVTQSKWQQVLSEIVTQYRVPENKIRVYCGYRNIITTPVDEADYENKRMEVARKGVSIVKQSLLLECEQDGEFDGVQRIIVVGNYDDACLIGDYFARRVNSEIEIITEAEMDSCYQTDKFIITGDAYKDEIARVKEDYAIDDVQWLLLPFFSIERLMKTG